MLLVKFSCVNKLLQNSPSSLYDQRGFHIRFDYIQSKECHFRRFEMTEAENFMDSDNVSFYVFWMFLKVK